MSAPSFEVPPPGGGFPDTWRRVITDPRGFFAEMPLAGGLTDPVVFVAICAAVNGVGRLLITWSLWSLVVSLVGLVVAAFVAATVLTLVAQQLFDGKAGFEPTFRVVAYAAAPAVFFWIPRLAVIAWIWGLYLQIRGVERVHDLEPARAVLAIAVSAAVTWLLAAGLAGALI